MACTCSSSSKISFSRQPTLDTLVARAKFFSAGPHSAIPVFLTIISCKCDTQIVRAARGNISLASWQPFLCFDIMVRRVPLGRSKAWHARQSSRKNQRHKLRLSDLTMAHVSSIYPPLLSQKVAVSSVKLKQLWTWALFNAMRRNKFLWAPSPGQTKTRFKYWPRY